MQLKFPSYASSDLTPPGTSYLTTIYEIELDRGPTNNPSMSASKDRSSVSRQ